MNRTTAIRLVEDWLLLLADTRDSNADTFIVWRDQETAIQQLLTAYKGMVVPIPDGIACLFCGYTTNAPEPAPRAQPEPTGISYILIAKNRTTGEIKRDTFTSTAARDAWIAGTSPFREVISIYEEDHEPCPPTQ